jgi:excinuclease UvrABC nuclease subunit
LIRVDPRLASYFDIEFQNQYRIIPKNTQGLAGLRQPMTKPTNDESKAKLHENGWLAQRTPDFNLMLPDSRRSPVLCHLQPQHGGAGKS